MGGPDPLFILAELELLWLAIAGSILFALVVGVGCDAVFFAAHHKVTHSHNIPIHHS